MSFLHIPASPSLHRKEIVPVALLLALTAGYLDIPNLALGIPVVALLIVLLCCEVRTHEASP